MAASGNFEYKCTLKDATLEVAKRELNEDPSTRMLELKAFRDRVQQYPGKHTRFPVSDESVMKVLTFRQGPESFRPLVV